MAPTSGQDYEVALCSLLFLRALRLTSGDFFLLSNHAQAGNVDDAVLLYRLEGDQGPEEYRAILLQAKHSDTRKEKRLTSSYPFSLRDYLKSFPEVKRRMLREPPVNVGNHRVRVRELSLVLYTNTGCEIGEAAVDVTDRPEARHLKDLLNTGGGRLLRIPEARPVGLPEGDETSDFLSHLILCTDQAGVVGTAAAMDGFLEGELRDLLKLTSRGDAAAAARDLSGEVKAWWGEKTARHLCRGSEEWSAVLRGQMSRLSDAKADLLDFTEDSLEELRFAPGKVWIRVTDEHEARAVTSRLLRARGSSLVKRTLDDDHRHCWGEVQALWGSNVCSTLVLDLTTGSTRLLEEAAAAAGGGRRCLVVIARGWGPPPTTTRGQGWREVDHLLEPTWSVLRQDTRDRLLEVPVRLLQGQDSAVPPPPLRDVINPQHVADVMTDQVIASLCDCEREVKLGSAAGVRLSFVPCDH